MLYVHYTKISGLDAEPSEPQSNRNSAKNQPQISHKSETDANSLAPFPQTVSTQHFYSTPTCNKILTYGDMHTHKVILTFTWLLFTSSTACFHLEGTNKQNGGTVIWKPIALAKEAIIKKYRISERSGFWLGQWHSPANPRANRSSFCFFLNVDRVNGLFFILIYVLFRHSVGRLLFLVIRCGFCCIAAGSVNNVGLAY